MVFHHGILIKNQNRYSFLVNVSISIPKMSFLYLYFWKCSGVTTLWPVSQTSLSVAMSVNQYT